MDLVKPVPVDTAKRKDTSKESTGFFAGFNRWKESTQQSFQKKMPKWALDYSTQITNAGVFFFTSVMIFSAFRGKAISKSIYEAQERLLKDAGYRGELLAKKMQELTASKVIKPPRLHRQRMVYLITAISSFALGAIFKEKPVTTEQRQKYDQMSLPEYMGVRLKEGFDPVNHSRQSVGLVGATSGALAIISALSQPGVVCTDRKWWWELRCFPGFPRCSS